MRYIRNLALVLGLLVLAACGGGSGDVAKVTLRGTVADVLARSTAGRSAAALTTTMAVVAVDEAGVVVASDSVGPSDPAFELLVPAGGQFVIEFRENGTDGNTVAVLFVDTGRAAFRAPDVPGEIDLSSIDIDLGTGRATSSAGSALASLLPAPPAGSPILNSDRDRDGIADGSDAFPFDPDERADADGDGVGDVADNCPAVANADQADSDRDGTGDACQPAPPPPADSDGDGIADAQDNCPTVSNAEQTDSNGNGVGDACEPPDSDGDGVADAQDNCPAIANADQADANGNRVGDACEPVAAAAAFTWIGNTPLTKTAAGSLLDNDANAGSVLAFSGATAHGNVTIAPDGTFTYTPATGFRGQDTFTYTVASAVRPEVTATGTVTVAMSTVAWYVKNDVPATGDGSFGRPFRTLAEAEGPQVLQGDTIFVFSGNGQASNQNLGIALKDNQKLLGQGMAFTFDLTLNGAAKTAVVVPGGTAPVISNDRGVQRDPPGARGVGVFLANGNEVAGLRVDGGALRLMDQGILGSGVTGFRLHDNLITNSRRAGIELSDPAGTGGVNVIAGNRLTGNGDQGIVVFNGAPGAGTEFALTISGNTVTGAGADGIEVQAAGASSIVTVGLLGNTVSGSGGRGIGGLVGVAALPAGGVDGSSLSLTLMGNAITGNSLGGIGLDALGAGQLVATIRDNSEISGNGIPVNNRSPGISILSVGESALVLAMDRNTISGNAGEGISVDVQEGSGAVAGIRANTLADNNKAGQAGTSNVEVITQLPSAGVALPMMCLLFADNAGTPGPAFNLQNDAVLGAFQVESSRTSNTPQPTLNLGLVPSIAVGAGVCNAPVLPAL